MSIVYKRLTFKFSMVDDTRVKYVVRVPKICDAPARNSVLIHLKERGTQVYQGHKTPSLGVSGREKDNSVERCMSQNLATHPRRRRGSNVRIVQLDAIHFLTIITGSPGRVRPYSCP